MDIVAFVAVIGDGAAFDDGFDGFGEEAHLLGVDAIVDIVLAVDGVAGGFEDVAEGGAEGGTASGTDGDRAVGVDGDELDVDLFGVVVCWFVEAVWVFEDFGEELGGPGGIEFEVDESRAGYFGGEDGMRYLRVPLPGGEGSTGCTSGTPVFITPPPGSGPGQALPLP